MRDPGPRIARVTKVTFCSSTSKTFNGELIYWNWDWLCYREIVQRHHLWYHEQHFWTFGVEFNCKFDVGSEITSKFGWSGTLEEITGNAGLLSSSLNPPLPRFETIATPLTALETFVPVSFRFSATYSSVVVADFHCIPRCRSLVVAPILERLVALNLF